MIREALPLLDGAVRNVELDYDQKGENDNGHLI